ncbi:hypothetical protein CVT24_001212 [Panaeolus cyanescens]|uniref:Uncharacterized protein n=1 Tax=Panaeolus cyanescens TaxID=181874 RepID=A0A409VU34_9AGAR|nr:hypothetical protein CVT24_001212 [Panaeolus cyanescens]
MPMDSEDILSEALEFLGGKPVVDDTEIHYGPLTLTLAPKEGKAITLLADHLFSPGLFLAERIERGLLDVKGKTVLELGAGSALPSLLLSTIPPPPSLIVITDYPDEGIISNLNQNAKRNAHLVVEGCTLLARGYDWGTDPEPILSLLPSPTGYDVLILSDLLHFFTAHDSLIVSIRYFLAKTSESRVYVGAGKYTQPHVCDNFLAKAKAAGLEMEEITVEGEEWMGNKAVSGLDKEDLNLRKAHCRYWIGLLPALKAIHKRKHLSELNGQRVAVDGYVWLHKGAYSCAEDIAQKKPTNKYVDFAMHRVRLLRHHNIEPYIVFDGGPLPAKSGTEKDRDKSRQESLARGRALVNQGRIDAAREYFVKAVDITPEMAYQLIKALKAEGVSYVVAPYEADAQLAYLVERKLVDAVLTEDSDLLVFGCPNVWFKFDPKEATVISISSHDFSSVVRTTSDPGSISLHKMTPPQFRAMAILSGCDYLPSIPGIGLKTAASLVNKHRTGEQVIRHIMREGKKQVPVGYLKMFQMAEKCFLHQRVYCPIEKRLVHLTPIDGPWNEEFDRYVGSDMDPTLARQIAVGDADPVSLKPMKDINPSYRPTVKTKQPARSPASTKGKEKAKQGGLMNFFGKNPVIPPLAKAESPTKMNKGSAGKASGKRTLAEITDQEAVQKHHKKHRNSTSPSRAAHSKFFSSRVVRRHSEGGLGPRNSVGPVASTSRLADKENEFEQDDDFISEPEPDDSVLSVVVHAELEQTSMEFSLDDFPDVVEQEDGYISPSPSDSRDFQDLSSPPKPDERRRAWNLPSIPQRKEIKGKDRQAFSDEEDDDFDDIEAVSSPISIRRKKTPFRLGNGQTLEDYIATPTRRRNQGESGPLGSSKVLVAPTPTPVKSNAFVLEVVSPSVQQGPDLRSMLVQDEDTDIGVVDNDYMDTDQNLSFGRIPEHPPLKLVSPDAPSPATPNESDAPMQERLGRRTIQVDGKMEEIDLDEEQRIFDEAARNAAVTEGLRRKFLFKPADSGFGPSGSARERAGALMKKGSQTSPSRKALAVNRSPGKLTTFLAGSGSHRALNLRRNEVNVTPQGRQTMLGPAPKSVPFAKTKKAKDVQLSYGSSSAGRQPGVLLKSEKPRLSRKMSDEVVDLTELDSEDEMFSNTPSNIRARLNLDSFRCS